MARAAMVALGSSAMFTQTPASTAFWNATARRISSANVGIFSSVSMVRVFSPSLLGIGGIIVNRTR